MTELSTSLLPAWANFYEIVGSSGAGLIGIQFIVVTLAVEMNRRTSTDSINAFGTPTLMNLGGAFLVSALMNVPWHSLFPISIALALCGLGGLTYSAIAIRRARRQTIYEPETEDWIWYTVLPCSLYGLLVLSAIFLRTSLIAPFGIGAVALGFLFVGIRNAWDSITYVVIAYRSDNSDTE